MAGAVRDEVIALVADRTGIAPAQLRDDRRLTEDLAIDGRTAWDIFGAIEERFGTDIGAMDRNFGRYFAVEPVATWHRLPFLLGCAFVAGIAAAAFDQGIFVGLLIWAVLIAATESVMRLMRQQPLSPIPVTVGEIVAAVEAGAWPEPPPV
jgi:acyl carrier protein